MIAGIVLFALATLLWAALALLCREMKRGDGFGRSMARSVGTLTLLTLAVLLGIFWGLAVWRGIITASNGGVIACALAATSFGAWMLLPKIGHPSLPRWLALAVLAPWAAHLALAGAALAPARPADGLSHAIIPATVIILGVVALPWLWLWDKK